MSEQLWWYLARAGGIVSWALLALSALLGLALAGKLLPRRRVAWVNEVHSYLGGLATIFTAIHVAGLVADNYVHFGWSEILVPMASSYRPVPVAVGVVAMYLLFAVEASSLLKERLPKRVWRAIHQLSLPLFALGTVHGYFSGTDASAPLYIVVTVVAVVAVAAVAAIRRVPMGSRAVRRA